MPQMQRCSLENTAPTLLDSERSRARGVSAPVHARACIARIMGSYFDPDASRMGCRMSHAKWEAGDQRLRRRDHPRCGARTRAGGICQVRAEPGKARCRFHGGLSTGSRTEEGRARASKAPGGVRWRAYRANQCTKSVGDCRPRAGPPRPDSPEPADAFAGSSATP